MITDVMKFKMDLTNFRKVVVPANHRALCVRIAIRLHQSIVAGCAMNPIGTPVLTGWARSNWAFAVGMTCPTQTIGERPPEGSMVITTIQSSAILQFAGPYPMIWVYNNAPYIEPLEDGHSTKAPTGMVANALHATQTFINTL
jgi:hypothetical protein